MNKNRRYSFFQLFAKGDYNKPGNYKLVIPIIQRDYAQGRETEKAREVRNDFLSQLFKYMNVPTGSYDLDFVYGTSDLSKDFSKKKEFIPLDGQQRLTTLFLIHLYLAVRSKGSIDSIRFFKTMQSKNGNLVESLFSYRTRASAVEFCNCLIDENNNFAEMFDKADNQKRKFQGKISDYIYNSNWFYPEWLQDSTVKGMLTMLDAIDGKFDECNHQYLLSRLMSSDDPSITFIFMDLEEYKLTDDLYIKMNSRGKPLTSFENFKAKFEQYIGRLENGVAVSENEIDEDLDRYKYVYQKENKKVKIDKAIFELGSEIKNRGNKIIKTVKDNFAFKIDTVWTNLFWKFSKNEIEEKEIRETDNCKTLDKLLSETLDFKISRFIKMVLSNQYAIAHKTGKVSIPEELIGEKELSFSNLEWIDAISADGVVLMTKMFELYSDRPLEIMPNWTKCYYNELAVFESMIKGKDFTFPKRLMQYAYTMFRMKFGDSHTQYLVEWMRFLFNMTLDENSIQDITRLTYHRAITSVNILLDRLDPEFPSIISLLSSDKKPVTIDFFPEHQYREEILKSYLLRKGHINVLHQQTAFDCATPLSEKESWETLILKLESHEYFNGQIGFVLKMAGISDYYLEHRNLDWENDFDIMMKHRFINYGKIASGIFAGGYSCRQLASEALFERAMLSQHPEYLDYNFLNSTNKTAGSNNLLRDLSWKSILRLSNGKNDLQDMVKNLFDQLDADNLKSSLNAIVDASIQGPQWRKDLVVYSYLMGKSRNGYFACTESGHRILKNSINFSMWDHEVYSLVLYWEYLNQKGQRNRISDFDLSYGNSNSWNEIPFVKLSKGNLNVKIKSYVMKESGDLRCHYLWIDSNGDSNLESYLEGKGFQKKNESDTILRREEMEWNKDTAIDNYRQNVTTNIISFITDLSSYLVERTE